MLNSISIKKGYSNSLHYYIYLSNKYVGVSVSIFWMRGFGIYFKKNGSSLDIHFDIFIASLNISFWDRELSKLLKRK